MKIITTITRLVLVSITIWCSINTSYAQNTFPPSGNVRIGILNSSSQLHLASDTDHEFKMSRGNGSAGLRIKRSAGAGVFFIDNTDNNGVWGTRIRIEEGGINWQNLIFNPAGGNVGIGNYDPQAKLHVSGAARFNYAALYEGSAEVGYLGIGQSFTGGWSYLPNALTLTYAKRDFAIGGWSKSTGTWMGAALYINSDNGRVGINTTNPGSFQLAVEGKIGAREVNVTATNPFPDYVFDSTYNLRPLSQVESFIKENKHLPEIPSAKEVEANGINLGEMDALLLKKIEELTLYMIEMKKENEELKKEDKRIQKENEEIKMKNTSLEQEIQQLKTK